jgi:hypothetical protein
MGGVRISRVVVAVAAFGASGAAACAGEPGDSVLVHVAVEEEVYRPQHLLVTWLLPSGPVVSDARVPKAGALPAEGRLIGSISISFARGAPRERRIVVKGMRGAVQVSAAAERLPAGLAGRSEITLVLGPLLADSDGDGLPDKVDDDCPAPGAAGCAPCPRVRCPGDGGAAGDVGAAGPGADVASTPAPDARGPQPPPAPDAASGVVDAALEREAGTGPAPDARDVPIDAPVDAAEPPPRPPGLVAYYRFDEAAGTTATDSSGSGNHGTHVNGPSPSTLAAPVTFPNRGSLRFDETRSQAVRVPDAPSLSLTGPFTLAAWVRPSAAPTGNQGVIEKWDWDGARARRGYFLRLEASRKPRAAVFDANGNGVDVPAVGPVPADVWTHVAAVFDGSTLRIYVNGAVQGTAPNAPAPADGASALEIGRSGGVSGFDGNIDEARVYARALTGQEIAALAQGNL